MEELYPPFLLYLKIKKEYMKKIPHYYINNDEVSYETWKEALEREDVFDTLVIKFDKEKTKEELMVEIQDLKDELKKVKDELTNLKTQLYIKPYPFYPYESWREFKVDDFPSYPYQTHITCTNNTDWTMRTEDLPKYEVTQTTEYKLK